MGASLLVFKNKSDVAGALDADEVRKVRPTTSALPAVGELEDVTSEVIPHGLQAYANRKRQKQRETYTASYDFGRRPTKLSGMSLGH